MSKSTYIPTSDHDFLIWMENFIANLNPQSGLLEPEITELKALRENFHTKATQASNAAALAKQATAAKNEIRDKAESRVRADVKLIKAQLNYSKVYGAQLGIEGPETSHDLASASPDLYGVDQTGGLVVLGFTKNKSEGINLYCQRENDIEWVLLGRATIASFQDSRPLLQTGKPELRRYTAIYMLKDKEVGQFSDEIVINCAP